MGMQLWNQNLPVYENLAVPVYGLRVWTDVDSALAVTSWRRAGVAVMQASKLRRLRAERNGPKVARYGVDWKRGGHDGL